MKKIVFISLFLSSVAYGAAAIFSGANVRILKQNLDLNGVAQLLSGTANPSLTATSANAGSMYMCTAGSTVFVKQDNGSSTNWKPVAAYTAPLGVSSGGTGLASLTSGYALIGNGTGNVSLVAPGSSGNVLTSNGSTWQSSANSPTVPNPLNFTQLSAVPTPSPSPGHDYMYTDTNDNLWLGTTSGAQEQVGPGMVGTNPASYTPTIVGMGTVTSSSWQWWRVGSDIIIQGGFTCGTASASAVSISLPPGITSSSALVTNQVVGMTAFNANVADNIYNLVSPSATVINMGLQYSGGNGYTPVAGTSLCTSNQTFTVMAEFPVSGWTVASPPAPGQAGASFFVSSLVSNTQSTAVTSIYPTFTTFSTSPGLSITPTITGTYVVFGSPGLNVTGGACYAKIINTSGSATLLYSTEATAYASGGTIESPRVEAYYTLTAGNTYVFDVQGSVSGSSCYLDSVHGGNNFYMFAELYAALGVNATTIGAPIDIGLPQFSDTGVFSQFTSTVSGYAQSIWQNLSSGSTASTDLIVNNDQGTATTHYGDFGINSSGFTGSGSLQKAGAVYVFAQTGDLVLATNTSNAVHILAGNSTTDAITVTTTNGIQFPALTTAGLIQNDGSGNITTFIPTEARYHGYTSGGVGVSGSFTSVLYATKDIDTTSSYSAGVYTCPTTGKYRCTTALYPTAATITAATKYTLEVLVNGSVYAAKDEWFATAATKPINPQLTTLFTCTAGQTVAVQGAYASSETTPSVTASNVYNFFEISKESP